MWYVGNSDTPLNVITILQNLQIPNIRISMDKPEHTDHLNPEKSPQRLNVESGRFY